MYRKQCAKVQTAHMMAAHAGSSMLKCIDVAEAVKPQVHGDLDVSSIQQTASYQSVSASSGMMIKMYCIY